jgi:hypothetical protein
MRNPTLRRGGTALGLALGLAWAAPAWGQEHAKPADNDEPAVAEDGALTIKSGNYHGVAPGGSKTDPPHAPRKKNPIRVTWTGFQMKAEGGSRVFVQLTSEAPYQVTDAPGGLHVVIKGARLHLRNNARPLDTHFFATPVKSIRAAEKGGEVMLMIETKGKAAHAERIEAAGGYQFLMIDFPPTSADNESSATSAN